MRTYHKYDRMAGSTATTILLIVFSCIAFSCNAVPPAVSPETTRPTTTDTTLPTTTDTSAGELQREIFPELAEGHDNGIAQWTVEIVERIQHDQEAFTQGLEVINQVMYESTGLYGRSSLRRVDPASGDVDTQIGLDNDLFGEGLTIVDDHIIQLTWRSGRALVYDRHTFELVDEHSYNGEGWGLCLMDGVLWMSDGTDHLMQREPDSFELIGTMIVTSSSGSMPVDNLNELECVQDRVIANVWQTNKLLVIEPGQSGRGHVVAIIHADALLEDAERASPGKQIDVLNGVADPRDGSGTLWMTGKFWPYMYRVRITPM